MNDLLTHFNRAQKISLGLGGVFVVLSIIGGVMEHHEFFISYLFGFIFWLGLSLGCLNVILILNLTGGRWGNGTRRVFEAGFMTLPLMVILFIPLLFGLSDVYPWAQPATVAADKILQQKSIYENFPEFLVRAIIFFAIWILFANRLRVWSLRQDLTTDDLPTNKMRTWSGPGIVIVPFTVTFAFVDWIMSIEPSWFSTAFALVVLASQVLTAFAFGIVVFARLYPFPPLREVAAEKEFLDLGNLLLASLMFWTYVAFSQFLIIYSGNQPHEIGWYLHRIAGGWKWLISLIGLLNFLVPFLLLLFRAFKQNPRPLAMTAALVFVMQIFETFWVILPAFYPSGFRIHWLDVTTFLGLGGIWAGVFIFNLKRHPLVIKKVLIELQGDAQPSHAQ